MIAVGSRSMSENHTGDRSQSRDWREIGCLICWKFCPESCVVTTDKVPVMLMDYCKGCAICAAECPQDCIAMVSEEAT